MGRVPFQNWRIKQRVAGVSALLVLGTAVVAGPLLSTPPAAAASFGDVTNFSTPGGIQHPSFVAMGSDGALWFTNDGNNQTSANNSIGRITTAGVVSTFTDPSIDLPGRIVAGPDGALWFVNQGSDSIGRITTSGVVSNFTDPSFDGLVGIVAGPDGALWFTNEGSDSIGRITTDGVVSNFPIAFNGPASITLGPDNAFWFAGVGEIGRMTTDGTLTTFTGNGSIKNPTSITAGPDGSLWFQNSSGSRFGATSQIGQLMTDGVVNIFPDRDLSDFGAGVDITAGPDGNVWFTTAFTIGRISPAGTITSFHPDVTGAEGITAGPDGALWFVNAGSNSVGRIATDGGIALYNVPLGTTQGITTGPDGASWFTDPGNNTIGRIDSQGGISTYVDTGAQSISSPQAIVTGSDNALWFTNAGNDSIGRITADGLISNYADPSISSPQGITSGPDGALWFTNSGNNSIGQITTGGVVSNFTDPSISAPQGIMSGPDGALWFTNAGNSSIGRITADGLISNYTDPSISAPEGITVGPDNALWFTEADSIGRITTAGALTTFTDPSINNATGIVTGPDDALWFVNGGVEGNASIGRITTDGAVTNYADPDAAISTGITAGSDEGLWFTTQENDIGRVQAGPPPLPSQAITFTSTPPTPPLVGASYAVSATGGGSGNPVVLSIDPSSTAGACALTGATVALLADGTCVVDADQAGDADFSPAPELSQTLAIQQPAPACPSATSNCGSAVGSDPNGTVQVNSGGPGGVTASATGAGALTVGHYATNPVSTPAVGATGEYFDVAASSDNQFGSVVIADCALDGGNVVQWWNPAGAGAWEAVSNQTYVPGSPDCVDITVSSATSPSLSDLSGTIFAVEKVTSRPQFTSAATTTFITGTAGSFTVDTTGFPTSVLSLSGTLPAGSVTFADNGDGTATLSGVAATGTAKTYSLKITAKNAIGSTTQAFKLVVTQAPAFTSAGTVTFSTGKSGTFKVTTSGAPASALVEAGALPQGLQFVDNGNGTATLSGSAAAGTGGTYPLTLTATNSAGSTNQAFTLLVHQAPQFISDATTTFVAAQAGTFTVDTTGIPTAALTLTGALPAGTGMAFVDNGDGTATLSGTPAVGTAKTYTLKITAKNAAGSTSQTFKLVVTQAPTFTSADTATFTTGKSGTFKVTTTGSPTAALILRHNMPPGINFVDNGNGTATISGTPPAGSGGTHSITIVANNTAGSALQLFTLVVNQAPQVTSAATTTFTVGTAGSFTVSTTGFPAAALSLTGALPAGTVTFVDNGDGTATLTGTASGTAKTYTLKVTAKNAAGSTSQTFKLVVSR